MAAPVYKLKDDHAACVGHVRGLYQRIVDEFATKATVTDGLSQMLKKDATRNLTNGPL